MGMVSSAFIQEYFRIRSGDSVGLNADSGWAAAENGNATIGTGLPFRIRFKVRETAGGSDSTGFKLQVNRNSGGWNDIDIIGGSTVPAAITVLSDQYANGDPTSTELLTNTTTYIDGEGLENDAATGNYSPTSEELELEWCLMIMSFHDGPTQNVASDTLEFRVVESDGTVFAGAYTNPTITVSETPGYVGGCFIESPCVNLIADANGNLYTIIEPSTTAGSIVSAMIKSTDGGDTWREMDSGNRPTTDDIEAVDIYQDGDTLHILIQDGSGGADVVYHTFRTSDHASADTWGTTDDSVTANTNAANQGCGVVVRSDGDIIAAYRYNDGSNERIGYKINDGSWGSQNNLDSTASTDFVFSALVMGASDKAHFFYRDATNYDIFHKSLSSADVLSGRETVESDASQDAADSWGTTNAVYWDDGGDEKIMVCVLDDSDKMLYSVVITNDGTPEARKQASGVAVSENRASSDQPTADVVVDTDTDIVYLLYADDSTNDLWRDEAVNDGGWGTDIEEQDGIVCDGVRGRAFTHSVGNGGATVLGYIYDNGGDGKCGFTWYNEYVLPIEVSMDALAFAGALPALAVLAGIQVNLDALAAAMQLKDMTFQPGPVSISPSTLQMQAAIPGLTVTSATLVSLNVLAATMSPESLAVTGGPVSIIVNALALAGGLPMLTIQPGVVSLPMGALAMVGGLPALTIQPGVVSLPMGALALAGGLPALVVQPGAVSLPMDILAMAGELPALVVQPGPVSIDVNALAFAGGLPALTVSTGIIVFMQGLGLQAAGLGLTVQPGAMSLPMDALALAGSLPAFVVQPGAVSLPMDALALAGELPALVVQPGAVSLPMDALALAGGLPALVVQPGVVSVALSMLSVQAGVPGLSVSVALIVALSMLAVGARADSLVVSSVQSIGPILRAAGVRLPDARSAMVELPDLVAALVLVPIIQDTEEL